MEPPIGVVIQKIPRQNSGNKSFGASGGSYKKESNSVRAYMCFNGEVQKADSIAEACRLVNKDLKGGGFLNLKKRGWHRFQDGAILFLDYERLTPELRDIVDKCNI
jgi:hypothetical protein